MCHSPEVPAGAALTLPQLIWFLALVAACIGGPYLLHVPPRTRRRWVALTVTLAFLAWVLLFLAPVRSR